MRRLIASWQRRGAESHRIDTATQQLLEGQQALREELDALLRDRGTTTPPVSDSSPDTLIEALRQQVEELAHVVRRAERHRSPAFWNDTGLALHPHVGTPADLVASVDDLGACVARYAARGDRVIGRVATWSAEQVRGFALADRQPIPASPDRVGYYGEDHVAYWLSGLGEWALIEDTATALGCPLGDGSVFLDFGCATGRILRHAAHTAPNVEAIGVDLGRQHVAWCRQHLRAPVLQTTALPVLPLADASVDAVYAGSVFTHISDLEEATLAELRRVVKPSGFVVLTILGDAAWRTVCADENHHIRRHIRAVDHRLDPGVEVIDDSVFVAGIPGGRAAFSATDWPDITTFHSHDWVRERWGRLWEIARLEAETHSAPQDTVVLIPRA